jgi:hypothetical protein
MAWCPICTARLKLGQSGTNPPVRRQDLEFGHFVGQTIAAASSVDAGVCQPRRAGIDCPPAEPEDLAARRHDEAPGMKAPAFTTRRGDQEEEPGSAPRLFSALFADARFLPCAPAAAASATAALFLLTLRRQ